MVIKSKWFVWCAPHLSRGARLGQFPKDKPKILKHLGWPVAGLYCWAVTSWARLAEAMPKTNISLSTIFSWLQSNYYWEVDGYFWCAPLHSFTSNGFREVFFYFLLLREKRGPLLIRTESKVIIKKLPLNSHKAQQRKREPYFYLFYLSYIRRFLPAAQAAGASHKWLAILILLFPTFVNLGKVAMRHIEISGRKISNRDSPTVLLF